MFEELQRTFRGKYFQKQQSADELIEQFKVGVHSILIDKLKGLYIIGSYGLNDFNPNLSDIDFIISIKDPLKAGEIEAIGKLHAEIERETIQPNLNGIYILESQIGQSADKIDRLTYYHEGKLYTVSNQRSYYEINPITWAELKLHGRSFYGQASESWNISIDWNPLGSNLNNFEFEHVRTHRGPCTSGSQNSDFGKNGQRRIEAI